MPHHKDPTTPVSPTYVSSEQLTSINVDEAQESLLELIAAVNATHEPVRITSEAGDAVLLSSVDYDGWQETVYLMSSPANARRLMEAVTGLKSALPRGDAANEEADRKAAGTLLHAEAEALAADDDDRAEAAQVLRDMRDGL